MNADQTPPAVLPDQADINIAVGPDAHLSPQVLQALEALAQAVEQSQSPAATPALNCPDVHVWSCKAYVSCTNVTGI